VLLQLQQAEREGITREQLGKWLGLPVETIREWQRLASRVNRAAWKRSYAQRSLRAYWRAQLEPVGQPVMVTPALAYSLSEIVQEGISRGDMAWSAQRGGELLTTGGRPLPRRHAEASAVRSMLEAYGKACAQLRVDPFIDPYQPSGNVW
jgi:hypothetical protein